MSEAQHSVETAPGTHAPRRDPWRALFGKEDLWAIWLALILVAAAYALFASGTSIKWLAVAPAKWTTLDEAARDLVAHLPSYLALYVLWAVLLAVSVKTLGFNVRHFLASFTLLGVDQ